VTNTPKTIQIFLPSGEPTGIRVAEITTRIIRVIEVPRLLLGDFFSMPEAAGGAVYFLFGENEDSGKPSVYIGQTGDLKKRLKKHKKDKEFWQRVVVMVSRAESLTTEHSLYLERLCIKRAVEAKRYATENGTEGNKLNTPKPLEAECEELFETGKILLSTLGFPVFQPLSKGAETPEQEIFFCTAAGTEARGEFTPEGMVVLKGSKARVQVAENFKGKPLFKAREKLIASGVLALQGQHYVFTQDYLFGSPSSASAIIVGNSQNGWLVWKNASGKTMDEIKRQPVVMAGEK